MRNSQLAMGHGNSAGVSSIQEYHDQVTVRLLRLLYGRNARHCASFPSGPRECRQWHNSPPIIPDALSSCGQGETYHRQRQPVPSRSYARQINSPDCGVGSKNPLSPNYCVVVEGSVCLDTGECGIDFGMRCYGGFPAYGSLRQSCPKGKWSD
jgi:hypothetical protein